MTPASGRIPARWVSGAVLDHAAAGPVAGAVTGRFGATLHAELDGFVIAVQAPGVPRMPNGLSIHGGVAGRPGIQVGDPARLSAGGLEVAGLSIAWDCDRPPRWDAGVPKWTAAQRQRLGERAKEILGPGDRRAGRDEPAEALARIEGFRDDDGEARAGVSSLLAAVRSGDPRAAARAGHRLAGRGPGLTPLGDDILAATALTVGSVADASAATSARWRAWLSALVPAGLRGRTTPVSATILELAIRGLGMSPVHALLAPDPRHARHVSGELDRIRRLGHTTGPAYAAAIGAVALVLAPPTRPPDQATKEQAR